MTNDPPPAVELARIDQELTWLETRKGHLLTRRAHLMSVLASAGPAPAPRPYGPPAPRRTTEPSAPGARNVLLALGGVLLTVAAIAFTLVSWGHLGIGGRTTVLNLFTLTALAAPVVLLRRKLAATAEAVAAFALVLTVLDACALYVLTRPEVDWLRYTAVACAVLAALWAGYGALLRELRGPLPVAVVTAQLPPLIWWSATGSGPLGAGWALLAAAVADTALVLWPAVRRDRWRSARATLVPCAATTGGLALLLGCLESARAGTAAAMTGPAVLLLAVAALGLLVAWRGPEGAFAAASGAALAAVAAVGGLFRTAAPEGWSVPGYLFCALGVLAVVGTGLPRPVRRGAGAVGGAVAALTLATAFPAVAVALLGGAAWTGRIWAGAPDGTWAALGVTQVPWLGTAPLVLAVNAGALALAYRALPRLAGDLVPAAVTGRLRTATLHGAATLGWAALLVQPVVWDLPYEAALALPLALTAAALARAVRPGRDGAFPALVLALAGTGAAPAPALASRPATLAVYAVLAALFTAAAVAVRTAPAPGGAAAEAEAPAPGADAAPEAEVPAPGAVDAVPVPGAGAGGHAGSGERVRALLACLAVGFVTVLVVAGCAAAGVSATGTALAVLGVPAAVALLAARLGRHPVAAPLEGAGAAAGVLAVWCAVREAPTLALVLALGGVIAAGTAIRPERRRVAGYAATALFTLATWVRLGASGVSVPEAYTVPVTVAALAVGFLRRRRDPEASSWPAYGPGLAATLLPSLVAAWGDTGWTRPLLLGAAALAVTLAGARWRLQAPLLLGGAVLALDALHELAPYVVQVMGALPRWLPPALAGLLLLAVGATYEQRLRDARRVRGSLRRMR
ncbi:hypothetical protein AB0O07_25260 [Streptomyces sp. NPDC093085]|uniref:SCO7613 C-terminal domain-containing membrane protein n=1 Tax=Streptomyces sp. NPDC093085 TaxID=3155068 RepID=UPI00343B73E8